MGEISGEGDVTTYPPAPDGSEHLSGLNDGFAYNTIKVRIPAILREARDYALNLENVGEKIAEMLTELIKCVEEDVIPDLEVKDGDFPLWDSFIQYFKRKGMNLLSMPWKVQDICSDASGDQKDIPDLFFESYKKDVHLGSKEYSELICLMASRAIETFTSDDDLNSKKEDATRLIEIFLQLSMWGNSVDLSIVRDIEAINTVNNALPSTLESTKTLDSLIILNHIKEASQYMYNNRNKRVDIILDNSGTELLSDICLADALLSIGIFSEVVLHVKKFQWFVSDATMSDFSYILRSLEASGLEDHKNLSSRCLLHIIEQRLILLDSPFWTTPCPYSTEYFLRHDVWTEELSKSSLIIFKGDLNYRKLISDIGWSSGTSIRTAFGELGSRREAPAILSLRVCKSPVSVGLDEDVRSNLENQDPKWSCTGKYAMATFLPPLSTT